MSPCQGEGNGFNSRTPLIRVHSKVVHSSWFCYELFTIYCELFLLRGRSMVGHLPLEQGILGPNPSPAAYTKTVPKGTVFVYTGLVRSSILVRECGIVIATTIAITVDHSPSVSKPRSSQPKSPSLILRHSLTLRIIPCVVCWTNSYYEE